MTDEKQIRKEIKQDFEKRKEAYKRIVEMVEIMAENWFNESMTDTAERLYNAGYRKIPENAVVLTREEYEIVLETQKHLEKRYSDMRDKLNFYKNENEIIKQNYIQLKQDNEQARKETAREILKYLMQFEGYAAYAGEELAKQYGVEIEE